MMDNKNLETATFAGGCFWCMEPPFDNLKGVVLVTVGYTGGDKENPTYQEVCSGKTGHAEAVQVIFDPSIISYEDLLDIYWKNIDPTTANKQFCDIGTQYRTVIYYHHHAQKEAAEKSKAKLEAEGRFNTIATEILPASTFFPAEDYHQKYYQKNPLRYQLYHHGSGRDKTLEDLWEK